MKFFLAVLCFTLLAGCFPNYSDGERVGVVTKISKKGLIFKSHEGEMLIGGGKLRMHEGSGRGNLGSFEFNVPDEPKLLKQIDEAARKGTPVVLTYRQWLIAPPWISNDHVLTAVQQPTE